MDTMNTATLAAKLYEVVNSYSLRQALARRAQDEAARVVRQAEENYSHVVVEGGDEDEAGQLLTLARERLARCQERARALALDPEEYRRALVEQDGPHRALALELDAMAEAEGRALVAEIEAGWDELAGLRARLAEGCEAQRTRLKRLGELFTAQDQGRAMLPRELRGTWHPGSILPPVLSFTPAPWPTPARSGKLAPGPLPAAETADPAPVQAKLEREMPPCAGKPISAGVWGWERDNGPVVGDIGRGV